MSNIVVYVPRRKHPNTALIGLCLLLMAAGICLTLLVHPQQEVVRYAPDNVATPAVVQKSQPTIASAPFNASKALVRLYQLDPGQYASQMEFDTWAYAACSAASMTEVMNAYGKHLRIHDVLAYEAQIGAITPDLGLLSTEGITHTVDHFGFKTTYLAAPSLDETIRIGNEGHPLIINFPPDKWDGGHLLVLLGGNATHVHLADSSRLNMQWMARSTFLKYWAGWGMIVELERAA